MSKIKLVVSMVLVLACVAALFCGCIVDGDTRAELNKPVEIFNKFEVDSNEAEYKTARIFIDNTYSVYGYILSGTGVESGYCSVVSRLLDFMDKYDNKEYYRLEDRNDRKDTEWVEYSGDNYNYRSMSFYDIYGKLSNPYEKLRELDQEDDGFNIYVTDLAEGADENKSLAADINENVISGENRSALLYCFFVKYNGVNYIDDPNVIKDASGDLTQIGNKISLNKKPIYVIISGATAEINAFCTEFNKSLEERGFEHGDDFEYEKFIPGRGLEKSEAAFRTDVFTYQDGGKPSDASDLEGVAREVEDNCSLSKEYFDNNS